MKAIVYTRISMDRYGDARGVDRQREDALQLVSQRSWQLMAEYEDNDISAAGKKTRPDFEKMLEHIATGEVNVVVSWSFDRLARNRRDELRLIEACQEHSITLALVRGSDIDMSTPAGRMVADIMATTARHEIEVKSDRQIRANLQRAQKGLPHRAHRAFGYGQDGITVVEHEAEHLRWAYSQILAGASLMSTAKNLNEAEVRTSKGGTWVAETLRRVLLNPRNAGLRYYKDEYVGKAVWEPIVSDDTFQATQAKLTDPSREILRERRVSHLLSSLAECGRCRDGTKMSVFYQPSGTRSYKCRRDHLTQKADPIDEFVEAVVIQRLSRPDAAAVTSPVESAVDVQALRDEATALRHRIDDAASMYAAGQIQAKQLAAITELCEQKIGELESQITASIAESPAADLIGAEDVAGVWSNLDLSRKRAILRSLFDHIYIHSPGQGVTKFKPETIELIWKGQDES